MSEVTVVTGLWDIGREGLREGWSRAYDFYLERFATLLGALRQNVIVFGEPELEAFVFAHRDRADTCFVQRPRAWLSAEFYDAIQAIRTRDDWRARAGWLADSAQGALPYYAPLVLAKPFLLNDARLVDPFGSTHFVWLDAGLTNTVHEGYFTDGRAVEAFAAADRMTFAAFPYAADAEVHGFEYGALCRYAGGAVERVCRGGAFGGPAEAVAQFNATYYNLLRDTVSAGLLGTEESLFSILARRNPERYTVFEIGADGLLWPFFEYLRDEGLPRLRVGLYVLTFNSPEQLGTLFASLRACDPALLSAPDLHVIDNSTEAAAREENARICAAQGAERVAFDNIGINGGRLFAAEDAERRGYDFHLFFEDDMTLLGPGAGTCRNGLARYVPEFYRKVLAVAQRSRLDFLKLSFTEFYGDNRKQWAWYNVPAEFRAAHWPQLPDREAVLTDEDLPPTALDFTDGHEGLAYAVGEVYYCNWPQVVSRAGNRRMFLEPQWERPFEQTWMSHFYQASAAGRLRGGVLLLSPVEHVRFDHYGEGDRREN